MKLNWGAGIVIFIALFIGMMVYMVFKTSGENTDLIATDYYAREVAFQDNINEQQNANHLDKEVVTSFTEDNNLEIKFPNIKSGEMYSGSIEFIRPSDKKLDLKLEIEVDSAGSQRISTGNFTSGLYYLNIKWGVNGESYAHNKKIVLP